MKPKPLMTLIDTRSGLPVEWGNSINALMESAATRDATDGIFPRNAQSLRAMKVRSNYRIVFSNIPRGCTIPTVFPKEVQHAH